jgi:hypothetical protein
MHTPQTLFGGDDLLLDAFSHSMTILANRLPSCHDICLVNMTPRNRLPQLSLKATSAAVFAARLAGCDADPAQTQKRAGASLTFCRCAPIAKRFV